MILLRLLLLGGLLMLLLVTELILGGLLARLGMILYFSYFILMPLYSRLESCQAVPERIGKR